MVTVIVMTPIIRDKDGLAKSSRHAGLTAEQRTAALVLSRSLAFARQPGTYAIPGERRGCEYHGKIA